jgi:hypothetical protein
VGCDPSVAQEAPRAEMAKRAFAATNLTRVLSCRPPEVAVRHLGI